MSRVFAMALGVTALAACGRLGFDEHSVDANREFDAQDMLGLCDERITASTLALYTFTDGVGDGSDSTGLHPAIWNTGESVIGPCGPAFGVVATGDVATVADSPDWQLQSGTIELELLPGDPDVMLRAIITRDAFGTGSSGHFALVMEPSGLLIARIQRDGQSFYRCSNEVLPPQAWASVSVAFGPEGFTLWVNGEQQVARSMASFDADSPVPCNDPYVLGITDDVPPANHNPWTIGAGNNQIVEGEMASSLELLGGAVDQVRIRSGWHAPGAFE